MTKTTITAYQIRDLEKDVDGLKSDVTKILTNHLPHIQEALATTNEKIKSLSDRVVVGVGINVVMVIAGVIGIILLIIG